MGGSAGNSRLLTTAALVLPLIGRLVKAWPVLSWSFLTENRGTT
jgi:hypothetical protein